MSIMTAGIIQQPYRLAMCTENSRRQFHSHAQVLLAERDQLMATIANQAQMIEHLLGGLTTPTIIDVANADADGYRNGFAAAIKSLPEQQYFTNWAAYTEWRASQIEAVGDLGGEVQS